MEQKKKPTRDEALIRLIRENAEKSIKIKSLEKELDKEKKNTDKRLKRLEEDFKRLSRLLAESDKTSRAIRDKSSSIEHDVNNVKDALRRIIRS